MFGFNLIKNQDLTELKESLTYHERMLEDIGWTNITSRDYSNQCYGDLGREKLEYIIKRCKRTSKTSPLAALWLELTKYFTFGQGLKTPLAEEEPLQDLINEFWLNPDNVMTFTGFEAQLALSDFLLNEGNYFFLLFVDKDSNVIVRLLSTLEIEDIIYDEKDRMRPIFYKVRDNSASYDYMNDTQHTSSGLDKYIYYPDISVADASVYGVPPEKLPESPNTRIYHVKVNHDINDKFGMPELYRGVPWIDNHKETAADMRTYNSAQAQFAYKKKIKGTPEQVRRMGSALQAQSTLKNIRAMTGSTQIENDGVNLQRMDMSTSGMASFEKSLNALQLMVSAAAGIGQQYFGDPSTGNLATAEKMELPLLRKFESRQRLYEAIYRVVINFQIIHKTLDTKFRGTVTTTDPKTNRYKLDTDESLEYNIAFPEIVVPNKKELAESLEIGREKLLITGEAASAVFMNAYNIDNVSEQQEKLADESEERKQLEKSMNTNSSSNSNNNTNESNDQESSDNDEEIEESKGCGCIGFNKPEIKEALEAPKKQIPPERFNKKYRAFNQKMNGYSKRLSGSYTRFKKGVIKDTEYMEQMGKTLIMNANLDNRIDVLINEMKAAARTYFPIGIKFGRDYMQSELKDLDRITESTISEAEFAIDQLEREELNRNALFLDTSLTKDLRKKIGDNGVKEFNSKKEAQQSIGKSLDSFDSRIEQYVGALWTVEETAVKEAGIGSDVMVVFAGPDDTHTCEGCNAAVSGNPYKIDEAPIPGTLDCFGNCRHALQVIGVREEEVI